MELSRREFLKMAGFASAGLLVAGSTGSLLTGCSPLLSMADPAMAGTQMAMFFIPSRCEWKDGCRECVLACHGKHNVPNHTNKNHEIKWIWETEMQHAFPEYMENAVLTNRMEEVPFLVMCNHCANPACVRVCPTKATFRREDGVVLMDYHRCIGCRFCVAACPYGARSFNFKDPRKVLKEEDIDPNFPTRTKGVVEKCNFCAERDIHGGELPYCVEACINRKGGDASASALFFGDLGRPEAGGHNGDAGEHGAEAPDVTVFADDMNTLMKNEGLIPLRRKEIAGTQPKVYYLV